MSGAFRKEKKQALPAGAQNSDDEFDDQYANAGQGYDSEYDEAVAEQQQIGTQVAESALSPVSVAAAAAPPAMGGSALAFEAAYGTAPMASMPLDATALIGQMLQTQRETNKLLSHLVLNSVADAHQASLKAMATGSGNVTREVHCFAQGTLDLFSKMPAAARLVIAAGSLPHTKGTLLDVTVIDGSNTLAAALMLSTEGIKNLAEPAVVSPSGIVGVCLIPAKCKALAKTAIISSVVSPFSQQFAALYPGFTADTLKSGLLENPITDKSGAKKIKVLSPAGHPVTEHILDKYEKNQIDKNDFWSELTQKYSFDDAEVKLAVNELKKKLVTENTAVNLDGISFPFCRAIISDAARNDTSSASHFKKWTDTEEIGAVIKSGNAAAELTKVGYVSLKLSVTYAPAPGCERVAK